MTTSTNRTRFDEKTKQQIVQAILSGETPLQEAAKAHKLQSYQLHAWIGQVAMGTPELVYEALDRRFAKRHGETVPSATTESGLLTTRVMEEYLRRILTRSTS